MAFQIWLATPSKQRKPATQQGWAKLHGYHNTTLSRWKTDPDFMAGVEQYRVKGLEKKLSDLYAAMMDHAIKGNHHYAKLVLEIVRDMFNKTSVEVSTADSATVKKMSDEQLTEKMFDILKNADPDGKLKKENFMKAFANNQVAGRTVGEA